MSNAPRIERLGLSGAIVTFDERLSERANLAALAFRAAVDVQGWADVNETASTLVSTYLSFDLAVVPFDEIRDRLQALLETCDWYAAAPPPGRKLWTVPMRFAPERAPQIAEVGREVGLSEYEVSQRLGCARTRIITLGFAPGQPYLGILPEIWDIPRQTKLAPRVPAGAW